ncbi:class I SAM-dependent methyltransferase [Kiloniella litopenaei]|uniref:class I SAM-dependent methyltransferase n=1 Tax=Kiloniella litopenaei TaxID=1549748 RepID=UPI003BAB2C7A
MKVKQFNTEYEYDLLTRYGEDKPLYQPMVNAFLLNEDRLLSFAESIEKTVPLLAEVTDEYWGEDMLPYWKNSWFGPLDAYSLATAINLWKPKTFLEIGSGVSTRFARLTLKKGNIASRLISIDPSPRMEVDALCDEVIRKPLEECDSHYFEQLEAGDILFYDGSHRCFQNSDVTVFFLEILPLLKKGVHVHIHDIFWPEDYPTHWVERYYNEQYLLALLFQHRTPEWAIDYGCRYVPHNEKLMAKYNKLEKRVGHTGIYPAGGSFWMTKQ